METNNITKSVQNTFANITRYPQEILTLSADLEEDLGIDSVKLSEIIAVLAEDYNFPTSLDLSSIKARNIQDVVHIIEQQVAEQNEESVATDISTSQPAIPQPDIKKSYEHFIGKVVFISETNSALGKELIQFFTKNGAHVTSDINSSIDFYIENTLQTFSGSLKAISSEQWESGFDTNVVGFHSNALQISKGMRKKGGGKIISLSSTSTQQYTPGHSFIAAIHSATASLTRYLCVELANFNIQVNCVSVGNVPATEIAHVVGQLLQQQSKFINGTTIVVDRGQNWTTR
ncbi:SDR family oxidoreductase [Candidatus Uabimicrobium sp. HlEnr_7]|uniref:SDR family oxidoreductase n=1 Tax=Candidatus Uabimicrobium helgolandensis TaxID=3095367 RepID=UPI0035581167